MEINVEERSDIMLLVSADNVLSTMLYACVDTRLQTSDIFDFSKDHRWSPEFAALRHAQKMRTPPTILPNRDTVYASKMYDHYCTL